MNQKGNIFAINIKGWKKKTRKLVSSFKGSYFQHIYGKSNVETDLLSKQALSALSGRLFYYS